MRLVTKSGCGKEKIKSKKTFDPYEGPYVVLARMSKVNFKVAKQSNPSKVKFLHFNMLKRCVDDTGYPEEAAARKRLTPYGRQSCLTIRRCTSKTRQFGQTVGRQSIMIHAQGKNP